MNRALIVLVISFVSALAVPAAGQNTRSKIYKLEELTWPQIDAFDRARTLFILPVGMIEEHGPHGRPCAVSAGGPGRRRTDDRKECGGRECPRGQAAGVAFETREAVK